MKAILEFNLPDDETEHTWAVNARHAWAALSEIRLFVRNHQKHGAPSNAENVLEQIRHIVIEAESWIGD